jgi:hypothetical protein
LPDALDELLAWVQDVPRCNDFRFFRLCDLNVHRLLVLRHLFHLHFSLRHALDGRNKPDDQDDHCALVSMKHLHVQDDRACQNLNEQDDQVSTKHLRVLDDQVSTRHHHVQDDRVCQNLNEQDGRVSKKQGALDELLFPDVPILKNPNELDARCENDLVLD